METSHVTRQILRRLAFALFVGALFYGSYTAMISSATAEESLMKNVEVGPLTFWPLEYFDDRCSRCHGPGGSFFGNSLKERMTEETLREAVREMAYGPAGAPISGVPMEAVVAYHRSMIDNHPFVTWTMTRDGVLGGEVTPRSVVWVRLGREMLRVNVEGRYWNVDIPDGWDVHNTVVIARLNQKTTVLDLSRENYSHTRPLQAKLSDP